MTIEKERGVSSKFSFKLSETEFAYQDNCIKGAFEFQEGWFFILVNDSNEFIFSKRIDSQTQL